MEARPAFDDRSERFESSPATFGSTEGPLAHSGERCDGIAEAVGSNPTRSIESGRTKQTRF